MMVLIFLASCLIGLALVGVSALTTWRRMRKPETDWLEGQLERSRRGLGWESTPRYVDPRLAEVWVHGEGSELANDAWVELKGEVEWAVRSSRLVPTAMARIALGIGGMMTAVATAIGLGSLSAERIVWGVTPLFTLAVASVVCHQIGQWAYRGVERRLEVWQDLVGVWAAKLGQNLGVEFAIPTRRVDRAATPTILARSSRSRHRSLLSRDRHPSSCSKPIEP